MLQRQKIQFDIIAPGSQEYCSRDHILILELPKRKKKKKIEIILHLFVNITYIFYRDLLEIPFLDLKYLGISTHAM